MVSVMYFVTLAFFFHGLADLCDSMHAFEGLQMFVLKFISSPELHGRLRVVGATEAAMINFPPCISHHTSKLYMS